MAQKGQNHGARVGKARTRRRNYIREGETVNEYQKRKANARQRAQEWQAEASQTAQSYAEILTAQEIFASLAKRYGLTAEFKENGII